MEFKILVCNTFLTEYCCDSYTNTLLILNNNHKIFLKFMQSALHIQRSGTHGGLTKGSEHPQISVSVGCPGTDPLWILCEKDTIKNAL